MSDTYFDRGFCNFFAQIPKTVIILSINWSELFILRVWFQVYSGSNTFLYACEVIKFISKSDFVVYSGVREMFFKFNILSLPYIRHYWASIKCQPFKNNPKVIQESNFAQNRKVNFKTLRSCFLRSNHIAALRVIYWNHYTLKY